MTITKLTNSASAPKAIPTRSPKAEKTDSERAKVAKKGAEPDFMAELAQASAMTQPENAAARTSEKGGTAEGKADLRIGSEPGEEKRGADESTKLSGARQSDLAKGSLNAASGQELLARKMEQHLTQGGPGRGSKMELHSAAERSPLTLKSAASTNTATAIAGLKPWSKDWVFQGMPDPSGLGTPGAEVKPLFSSEGKKPEGLSADDLKALGFSLAAAPDVLGQGPNPEATRGDAGSMAQAPANQQALRGVDAANISGLSQLSEMNGSLVLAEAGSQDGAPVLKSGLKDSLLAKTAGRASGTNGSAGMNMSGAEFLSAMAAVRPGAGSEKGNQAGDQGANRQMGQGATKPDLRVIEGGAKGRKAELSKADEAMGAAGLHAMQDRHVAGTAQPVMELPGHVTKGAISQDRLSSESLNGLSGGIRTLNSNGGGEIRMRLRPDNLGEVHVQVVTQGNSVGLRIQASDERAKKIIEESIGHLKDSLASQHLSLGQLELTVASSQSASAGGNDTQDRGQQTPGQQAFQQDLMGQMGQSNQERGRQSWGSSEGTSSGENHRMTGAAGMQRASVAAMAAAGSRSTAGASGRLDVMA